MSKPCPICRGPGVLLGALGRMKHFRCRDCGMQFSRMPKPRPAKPAAKPAPATT